MNYQVLSMKLLLFFIFIGKIDYLIFLQLYKTKITNKVFDGLHGSFTELGQNCVSFHCTINTVYTINPKYKQNITIFVWPSLFIFLFIQHTKRNYLYKALMNSFAFEWLILEKKKRSLNFHQYRLKKVYNYQTSYIYVCYDKKKRPFS